MDKEQEREEREQQQKLAAKNRDLAKKKCKQGYWYIIDDQENKALKQRSYTSFGKLILAKEKNAPLFSFGNAQRDQPIKAQRGTPGPIYDVHDRTKYKKSSAWKIGDGPRPPLYNAEKHPYFEHPYDPVTNPY